MTTQSAYAQHILQNLHKYGSITHTMSLIKPIHKTSMLIPYEQLFIQIFHYNGNLITEQGTGEKKTLISVSHRHHAYVSKHTKEKQTNTPPITHSNQFRLFHNNNRQQYGYVHYSLFYRTYCIFRRIYIIQKL
jgi:hypothetical protein